MIEAIKYFENHVSSSVEPFETMVLELLPLELHNQLTSEFKKILEADSQKDK